MKYVNVRLPSGNSFITAAIPEANLMGIFTRKNTPGLKDEGAAILEALRNPIGSKPLRDHLEKNMKVTIIVTDNTRPCPDDRILPVLLTELERIVSRPNITIIVALGLHPALNQEELVAKLGRQIVENYNVINHDPDRTVHIGETSRGTPVEINTAVAGADFRISTGFIEPHFFAGFSGGSKSIAPGVSSRRSIRKNHSYSMLEHPHSRAGILERNPVHEDIVEQARMAGLDFIVNIFLNERREIPHVVAGDPVLAHEEGCRVVAETAGVKLDGPADIVLVSNGGAPLDLDFYQTCKGIDTAARVTRDGGVIIMVSSCYTGVGPDDFVKLHAAADSPQDVLTKISRPESHGVAWQNQMLARAQLKHRVFLLSTLEDRLVEPMMVTPIHSVGAGLEKAFESLGKDARIAVLPEGPLVLPIISQEQRPAS